MSVVADVSQPLAEVLTPPPLAEVVALPGPKVSLWRLSVDQYHEMTRHGVLGERTTSNSWMEFWLRRCREARRTALLSC